MNSAETILEIFLKNKILIILALILILVRIFKLSKPKIKGYVGELTIRFLLLFLNKKEYKVINDVRLFHNGLMSQIDHIVVSKYGIFVIETKNYKGWIFGHEKSYEWTQVIFNNQYKLYNPVKQNLGHIKALKANLNHFPYLDYFPIVVFTGGAKLKVNSSFPVVKYYNLLKTIKNNKEVNITENMRDEIVELILKLNGYKPLIVPKKFDDKDYQYSSAQSCPDCGSPLISKQGKFGRFYGCTDFPRCRYTKRLS